MLIKKLTVVISIVSLLFPIHVFGAACPPPFCGPAVRNPVIILPGIAASRNLDLMVSGIFSDEWKLNTNTYNDLVNAFVNEGYELDKDLFIGFYDWRKSNVESVTNYLIPLIDKALDTSGAFQVDIVAHSMGGLVARSYIQSDDYRFDVDQLVLLGTPSKGSTDSYLLWEGADLPPDWTAGAKFMVSSYINLLTLKSGGSLSRVQALRSNLPSVKQLLPVYDFLVNKDTGETIPYTSLSEVNTFLSDLNTNIDDELLNKGVQVSTISGDELGTISRMSVVERSFADELIGQWEDGKPDPYPPGKDSNQGDNRVLLSSVQIDGATNQILDNGVHDRLPTLAQQDVVEIIVGNHPTPVYDTPDPESILGFMIASPLEVKITDPEGNVISKTISEIPGAQFDSETDPLGVKMIIIPNPLGGEYKVELTGIGNGEYHLITGFADTDNNISDVKEGSVIEGQIIEYTTTVDIENNENPLETQLVDIDPPVITINAPENGKAYRNDGMPVIDVSITDESEIVNQELRLNSNPVSNGQAIDLSMQHLGNHIFSVNVTDEHGNEGHATSTFSIFVTPESLKNNIAHYLPLGLIKNKGVSQALIAILDLYQKAPNPKAKQALKKSFEATVLVGKKTKLITPQGADLLIEQVKAL